MSVGENSMLHLIPAMALLVSAAPARPFHIDDIIPGESAESDCFVAYWRTSAKPGKDSEIPNIFEIVGNRGFIKIDSQVFALPLLEARATPGAPADYGAADTPMVEESHVMTRIEKEPDGNTYHLKGTLKITHNGQRQTVSVKGEDFCYSGG